VCRLPLPWVLLLLGPQRGSAWTGFQKIREQLVPVFSEDGLGMELHTFDRQAAVAHAHDLLDAAIGIFGPCSDFEAVGQAFLLDHQRVVASGIEGVRQAAEHTLPAMVDGGYLAVHDAPGANDPATEGGADGLVAEADAEQRNAAGEVFYRGDGNTRLIGRAGAGRDHDVA